MNKNLHKYEFFIKYGYRCGDSKVALCRLVPMTYIADLDFSNCPLLQIEIVLMKYHLLIEIISNENQSK